MKLVHLSLTVAFWAVGLAHAGPINVYNPPTPPPQTGNPAYSQDTVLSDLTNGITNYATFVYYGSADSGTGVSGNTPYTPTGNELLSQAYRFTGDLGTSAVPDRSVVVQFSSPVAQIVVFPNIDHVGQYWDGYQFQIWGGVPDTSNPNQIDFNTLLFDPLTVIGSSVPDTCSLSSDQHFTLGTWSGTAPTLINNTLTLGNEPAFTCAGSPVLGRGASGYIGYEEYFTFSSAYQFYGFRTSSLANTFTQEQPAERDFEISAVAASVPEPSTLILLGLGLAALCFGRCTK